MKGLHMSERLAEVGIYREKDGTVRAVVRVDDGSNAIVDIGKIAGFATLQALLERVATVVGKRAAHRARHAEKGAA